MTTPRPTSRPTSPRAKTKDLEGIWGFYTGSGRPHPGFPNDQTTRELAYYAQRDRNAV